MILIGRLAWCLDGSSIIGGKICHNDIKVCYNIFFNVVINKSLSDAMLNNICAIFFPKTLVAI